MERRTFLVGTLAGGLLATPLAAEAQPATREIGDDRHPDRHRGAELRPSGQDNVYVLPHEVGRKHSKRDRVRIAQAPLEQGLPARADQVIE